MKFYHESVGECVSQVYDIAADTWEEAKKVAFDDMDVGDYIAMCDDGAVREYDIFPEYHYISEDMCREFAKLEKGCWATYEDTGEEYWEDRVYYFTDDPDTYLGYNGNEFEDWKQHD